MSSNAGLYPNLNNLANDLSAPSAPNPTAPDIRDEVQPSIDWTMRLACHRAAHKVPVKNQARIMRPVGVALSALAVVFGQITADVALTMTATPLVVLGSIGALSVLTLTTASIALYLLFFRTYNSSTPESKIKKEQELVTDIQSNTNLTWDQVRLKFPMGRSPFNTVELDIIYFKDQVGGFTAKEFIDRNGMEAIDQLTSTRQEALAQKFLAEIAQEDTGLIALRNANADQLRALDITHETVWNSIRAREVARGYGSLVERNGERVLSTLTDVEKQAVGNSFLAETFTAMKDISGYQEKMKAAAAVGVLNKYKKGLGEWFVTQCAGMKPFTLQAIVDRFGIEVVDPIFLVEDDVCLAPFVRDCDFAKDNNAIRVLLAKGMLDVELKKAMAKHFREEMHKAKMGWVEINLLYGSFVRDLDITLGSVMPYIESHEVAYGYQGFLQRNGAEAFQFLGETSKDLLRQSFFKQIKHYNLDSAIEIPAGGEYLEITHAMIAASRVEWFKRELAGLVNPSIQDLCKRFGQAVLDHKFLPPQDERTKAMVRRSLATLHFEDDVRFADALKELSYLDASQSNHLNETRRAIAVLQNENRASITTAEGPYRGSVSTVESRYAPLLERVAQAQRTAKTDYETVANRYKQEIDNFQTNIGHHKTAKLGFEQALARVRTSLAQAETENGELHSKIVQADSVSTNLEIAAVDRECARIEIERHRYPVTIFGMGQIATIKNELAQIQARQDASRNNDASLRTKVGELEATKLALGENITVSLESLEAQRRAAATVTGGKAALATYMPGSDYSRNLKAIDDKIALKRKYESLQQDIARLRAEQSPVSTADQARKDTLERELRPLEAIAAANEASLKAHADLNGQREQLINRKAELLQLPGKIAAMKDTYAQKERAIAELRREEGALQNNLSATQSRIENFEHNLKGIQTAFEIAERTYKTYLEESKQHAVRITADKKAELDALAAEHAGYKAGINAEFQAKISQAKIYFRNQYQS